MKELKAVEILTDNLHKAEQYLAIAPMDSDMLRGWAEIIKEHSEALAELKELMQEKSCETCRTSCGLKQAYIKKTAQSVVYCNAYKRKG